MNVTMIIQLSGALLQSDSLPVALFLMEQQGRLVELYVMMEKNRFSWGIKMVTCYLKYVLDPYKINEFEEYGKMWIRLVNKLGGAHQGYFLPHEVLIILLMHYSLSQV